MSPAGLRGRFVWHELMTTDPKAAENFYTAVVGWKAKPWEQDSSYTMWLNADGPVGGLMALTDEARAGGARPQWLAHIGTPDVDATVDAAVRLGGRLLKAAVPIPDVGRFAIVADPQGAAFAPFTPHLPMESSDTPRLGEFSWHELATGDQAAALAYYQELFGWEKTDAMDMGPDGTYQMFGWGGKSMGGIYTRSKEVPAPPQWLCYAMVPDAGKAAAAVQRSGGRVLNGPMEVPGGGLIAQCLDPQGVGFALHSAKPVTPVKAKEKAPGKKAARR